MGTVFCTQCGQQNTDDAKFCARCGATLSRPGSERGPDATSMLNLESLEEPSESESIAESIIDGLPPGSALLVVRRGPNAGSRFLLDKEVTSAGRHPESDIFLDDVTVSRRHAEFHRRGNAFVVRDVGSLNGTYLNRERIEEAPLVSGDEVQIGKFRLVYLTAEGQLG
ncbi:MAG: FHA domain-containing protein [Mycobacteriales bacterium]